MAKGSQKQRSKLQKIVKAKVPHFTLGALEYIARLKNDWIPEKLANLITLEDQEAKRFLLCFDYLKEEECKLEGFNPAHAKALIRKFKRITDYEVRRKIEIIRCKISNNDSYRPLFNRLSPDVELYEMEFTGDGRIFFFNVAERLHIISIEDCHRNIDK